MTGGPTNRTKFAVLGHDTSKNRGTIPHEDFAGPLDVNGGNAMMISR